MGFFNSLLKASPAVRFDHPIRIQLGRLTYYVKSIHLLLGQVEVCCAQVVSELFHGTRPEDDAGYRRPGAQPGQGDLSVADAPFVGDPAHSLYRLPVPLGCAAVPGLGLLFGRCGNATSYIQKLCTGINKEGGVS